MWLEIVISGLCFVIFLLGYTALLYWLFDEERVKVLPFFEMLNDLQEDEGNEIIQLVSNWNDTERSNIAENFSKAWESGGFTGFQIRLPGELSNQSRGTKLWNEFRPLLEAGLNNFEFQKCKNQGYPDHRLVSDSGRNYAFEEKAHSKWDETDGNRIVICSSTRRLRNNFHPPINHIWATLYHSVEKEDEEIVCTLHSLQLHFVEPETMVARRLEISTSNKLLSSSIENENHKKVSFGNLPE
tara:strand:+ start:599 stop:1324 length:726 start_codon:yes stop_codon:yes gene_type:complete